MIDARATLALALDPLVLASRRRTLWVYLIASTLVAGAAVLGLGLSVDLARPVELRPGQEVTVDFGAPLVPGTTRIALGAHRAGEDGVTTLAEDEAGALVGGRAATGRIDAPGGVVGLTLEAGSAALASSAVVTAAVPLSALSGAARAEALEDGRGTRLSAFGLEILHDATLRPRAAAPQLVGTVVYGLVVRGLAFFFGVILGLLAMVDAVPSAFEPGTAELLLSRPVGRAQVVLARFLGALVFAGLQAGWLVGLTVLLCGLRLGVWMPQHLLALGPLLLKFATLLAVSTLAATWARAWALGLGAATAVWVGSFAIQTVAESAAALPAGLSPAALGAARRAIPQVTRLDDLAGALVDQVNLALVPDLWPWFVVGQCLVWTVLCLGLTCWVVSRRDL